MDWDCILTTIKEWIPLIGIITGIAAVIGLFLNWKAIRENRKTRELQIFYTVFKDIKELEEKQPKYFNEGHQQAWNSLFFNTLEYFSFLLNRKMISDKRVAEFFRDPIKAWYEQIFLKTDPKSLNNKTVYPELKALYKKIIK